MVNVVVTAAQVSSFSPEQTEQIRPWLSVEEAERNSRYRFAKDRHRDLVARGLVRGQLARQMNIEPEQLVFSKNQHGKPELVSPSCPDNLFFNLSHAGDWAVMAISSVPVGIDIEFTPRQNDVLAIADRYFFGLEYQQLMAYPEVIRRERFFDFWTLKEAYMKARGEGISLGLSNFGFCLESGITLQLSEAIDDDPSQWRFKCTTPFKDYRQAIAVRTADIGDISYNCLKPDYFDRT